MSHLVRVFQAVTKPGRESEFEAFFLGEALQIVQQQDGLVSVTIGLPTESTPGRFLMVTKWISIEALAGFTGERWDEAVIDEREAPLLEKAQVHHYWEAAIQDRTPRLDSSQAPTQPGTGEGRD